MLKLEVFKIVGGTRYLIGTNRAPFTSERLESFRKFAQRESITEGRQADLTEADPYAPRVAVLESPQAKEEYQDGQLVARYELQGVLI